ncbi:MAG: efflux RND transporter periplasmic adaptor subunit [Alistipes sp.]|nr:efflux RND transporter periplasmic adaptor subunit [Alistipes sp.]
MKRKWIVTTILIIVICAIGAGYKYYTTHHVAADKSQPATKAAPAARNILNVNGLIVSTQTLTDDIAMTGNLLPDEEVDLTFETSGKIVEINFKEGTAVRKGDLLAKVNDKPLVAQLARYEAQLKLAQDRVYRHSALLERDAVSQEAYEQARTELAKLNAEIEIINSNIALTELRAPFDGIIGLRNVSEGAYASPNVVVAKLTKVSPLKIDMYIPERYADQIRIGTPLTFTVEGQNTTYRAEVYAKESEVDKATRTLAVRATYPNKNGRLMPGRFIAARIRMQDIPNAIAIPTEAIVPEMGVDKVYTYRSGKAHAVTVKTGLRTDALIHIVEGLSVGDTIITSGTLQLREDLPVKLDIVE